MVRTVYKKVWEVGRISFWGLPDRRIQKAFLYISDLGGAWANQVLTVRRVQWQTFWDSSFVTSQQEGLLGAQDSANGPRIRLHFLEHFSSSLVSEQSVLSISWFDTFCDPSVTCSFRFFFGGSVMICVRKKFLLIGVLLKISRRNRVLTRKFEIKIIEVKITAVDVIWISLYCTTGAIFMDTVKKLPAIFNA